jgi:hypothetical protein
MGHANAHHAARARFGPYAALRAFNDLAPFIACTAGVYHRHQ